MRRRLPLSLVVRGVSSSAVLACAVALANCSGGGPLGGDPRVAAVQQALNRSPLTWASLPTIRACDSTIHEQAQSSAYVGLPDATVGPPVPEYPGGAGGPQSPYTRLKCRSIRWDPKVVVYPGEVSLGRYVVEKVGPDQTQMGVTFAAFRARFESSPLGRAIVARGLHYVPRSSIEGSAEFTKDADGNTRADLLP